MARTITGGERLPSPVLYSPSQGISPVDVHASRFYTADDTLTTSVSKTTMQHFPLSPNRTIPKPYDLGLDPFILRLTVTGRKFGLPRTTSLQYALIDRAYDLGSVCGAWARALARVIRAIKDDQEPQRLQDEFFAKGWQH